jgi:DNA-binding NtrC family response regulator
MAPLTGIRGSRQGETERAAPWPGNVRELKDCIECAVRLCSGTVLQPYRLLP